MDERMFMVYAARSRRLGPRSMGTTVESGKKRKKKKELQEQREKEREGEVEEWVCERRRWCLNCSEGCIFGSPGSAFRSQWEWSVGIWHKIYWSSCPNLRYCQTSLWFHNALLLSICSTLLSRMQGLMQFVFLYGKHCQCSTFFTWQSTHASSVQNVWHIHRFPTELKI